MWILKILFWIFLFIFLSNECCFKLFLWYYHVMDQGVTLADTSLLFCHIIQKRMQNSWKLYPCLITISKVITNYFLSYSNSHSNLIYFILCSMVSMQFSSTFTINSTFYHKSLTFFPPFNAYYFLFSLTPVIE